VREFGCSTRPGLRPAHSASRHKQQGLSDRLKSGEIPQKRRLVLACGGHYAIGADCPRIDSLPVANDEGARGAGVWAARSHSFTMAVPATARRFQSGLQARESTETSLASSGKPRGTGCFGLVILHRRTFPHSSPLMNMSLPVQKQEAGRKSARRALVQL
jgi:hypothetical protein